MLLFFLSRLIFTFFSDPRLIFFRKLRPDIVPPKYYTATYITQLPTPYFIIITTSLLFLWTQMFRIKKKYSRNSKTWKIFFINYYSCLYFNIDGLPVYISCKTQFWPILFQANFNRNKKFFLCLCALFVADSKPDFKYFFESFISEFILLLLGY